MQWNAKNINEELVYTNTLFQDSPFQQQDEESHNVFDAAGER